MARGRGAHAGKHGVDEPRGRHPALIGPSGRRAAAPRRRDQRVPREARAAMTPRRVWLRSRLLYLAAAGFLPLALMSGISLLALVQQQREQAERASIEVTRALSTAVDAELQRSISALQILASSPTLEPRQIGRFHQIIVRALDYNPTWLTVILADPSGKQVLNARLGPSADLPTTVEPESFDLATRTRRPLVGYLARGGGDFAVPVRVPVMRNGELRYVLTAAGQPDRLRDLLNRQRVT